MQQLETATGSYSKGASCGRGNHDYSIDRGTYVKCPRCGSTRTKAQARAAAPAPAGEPVRVPWLPATPALPAPAPEDLSKAFEVDPETGVAWRRVDPKPPRLAPYLARFLEEREREAALARRVKLDECTMAVIRACTLTPGQVAARREAARGDLAYAVRYRVDGGENGSFSMAGEVRAKSPGDAAQRALAVAAENGWAVVSVGAGRP